jgi:mRNA interferase MazF
MEISQYQVVLVNLEPTIGSEIRKTRPCLVISPDVMNRHLQTLVVAPMTTAVKSYPTRVPVHFQGVAGAVALDQIRTLNRRRVIKVLGSISPTEVEQCKRILHETYVR